MYNVTVLRLICKSLYDCQGHGSVDFWKKSILMLTMSKSQFWFLENMLIVNISDKYMNDKLKLEVSGVLHFESESFEIIPSLKFSLTDNFTLTGECRIFGGDDEKSIFGQFDGNDYVQLGAVYSF